MSGQMRLLLDKSVVRRYFEGISALARDRSLTEEQRQAIILVHLTPKRGDELFIAQEAANLIRAHSHELCAGRIVDALAPCQSPVSRALLQALGAPLTQANVYA